MITSAIRVALADDHALLREGLRQILTAQDDIVVVGEAGDSAGALAVVAAEKPDVVLLDVEMPGEDVTVTVRKMKAASPGTEVIILSMYDRHHLVQSLLALGIKGYLLKSVAGEQVVAAIRSATAEDGNIVLSISAQSLSAASDFDNVLSDRERAVLQLAASAMSNIQIASRLSLTEATVKRHLHNIFTKLDAVSRIDAVNKAVARSLILPPEPDGAGPAHRP
jgi:DNA-binding NarL/FixJ family response regulator